MNFREFAVITFYMTDGHTPECEEVKVILVGAGCAGARLPTVLSRFWKHSQIYA